MFYSKAIQHSDIQSHFDEEIISITGSSFMKLSEAGASIIIKNLHVMHQKCEHRWHFYRKVKDYF